LLLLEESVREKEGKSKRDDELQPETAIATPTTAKSPQAQRP
jgi:hypothetical protein